MKKIDDMTNEDLIKGLLIVVIVVLLIAIITVLIPDKKEETKIDLMSLNSTIEQKGGFSEMSMQTIDKEMLTNMFGIEDTSTVKEVIGKIPLIDIKSSMYLVIEAENGKVDYVKQKIEDYAIKYEEKWSTYLPDQHNLVKAKQVGNIGNYVYLIVAENAEEIKGLIN